MDNSPMQFKGKRVKLRLGQVCKDHNVSLSKNLQVIGMIDKATEERCKLHMKWKIKSDKKYADPRQGDFPEFEPICMDDRLSVRHIGQDVHIVRKVVRKTILSKTVTQCTG
eukprot:3881424-Amphidinium_carterae.1